MKKIAVLWVMMVCVVSVFAAANQERAPMHLDIGANYLYVYESGSDKGIGAQTNLHAFGPVLTFTGRNSKDSKWFTSTNVSFNFPVYQDTIVNGKKAAVNLKSYSLYYAASVNMGFLYSFVDKPKINFSLGPAINFLAVSMNTEYLSVAGFYFGFGLAAQSMIFVTNNVYMAVGARILYNPWAFTIANTGYGLTSNFGIATNIMVMPKLGIGVKF